MQRNDRENVYAISRAKVFTITRIRNVKKITKIDNLETKLKWTKKYTAMKSYSLANATGNIYFRNLELFQPRILAKFMPPVKTKKLFVDAQRQANSAGEKNIINLIARKPEIRIKLKYNRTIR